MVVLLAAVAALGPLLIGVETTTDDGYYYLRIAQHLAAGEGSTFDGLNPTNGYHPLWLIILTSVFWLFPEPFSALRGAQALQLVAYATASGIAYAAMRRLTCSGAALVGTLVWLVLTSRSALTGLEFAIHSLCLMAFVLAYLGTCVAGREDHLLRRRFLLLGCLAAAAFLARLDSVVVTAPLLGMVWRERLRASEPRIALRDAPLLAAPLAATGLAYLVTNRLLFGHFWTVSAAIKQAWASKALAADPTFVRSGWLIAKLKLAMTPALGFWTPWTHRAICYGVFFAAVVWSAIALRSMVSGEHPPGLRHAVFLVLASVLGYAVYVAVLHGPQAVTPWYFVLQPWVAGLTVAVMGNSLARKLRRLAVPPTVIATATLVVVLLLLGALSEATRSAWDVRGQPPHPAVAWTVENIPESARIGAWHSGTLSFLTGRQVINLDGLVNSWEYYDRDRHNLCRYWRQQDIEYLIDSFRGKIAAGVDPASYARCTESMTKVIDFDRRGVAVFRLSF